jgi:hypothetical protein
MLSIRARRTGITTGIDREVSIEDWPFALDKPSPPFAWGAIVALVHKREDAELIIRALNAYQKEKE